MTIHQMHIEIDQGVQEMGANTWDKFEPEQVDLIINKIINGYINSTVFGDNSTIKDFYVDQSMVAPIRTLLVRDRELPLDFNNYGVLGGEYKSPLPNDFRYIVKAKSEVAYDCKDITNVKEVSKSDISSLIELNLTSGTTYPSLRITKDNNLLIQYEKPFNKEDSYRAIQYIVSNNDTIYWERYGNLYKPNTFIILGDHNINAVLGTKVIVGKKNYNSLYNYKSVEELETRISKHEFYSSADIDDLDDDPYGKTSPTQPNSTIYGSQLITKTDRSYLLISTKIDYIRNPRAVDINLGINCELPVDTHDEIVDRSVKHILSIIENSNKYQLSIAELLNR